MYVLTIFTANSNDDINDDPVPVISGAVSVTVVLVIIFVLCIVVYYIRRSHSKRKAGSDIIMTSNPSYDINNKENIKQEYQSYDYVTPDKFFHLQDNKLKLDTNLSYGRIQECEASFYDSVNAARQEHDVAIEPNPCNLMKISGYVKSDQDYSHSTKGADIVYLEIVGPNTKEESPAVLAANIVNVTIDPNPSYESMSGGVKLEDNPSYNKIKLK